MLTPLRLLITIVVSAAIPSLVAAAPFAYITNQSDATVSVVDTATNLVIATVPVGSQPFGVAVTPNGARVYVTSWAGSVSVIDTATNTVTGPPIQVGGQPWGVAVSPDGAHVYVANYSARIVSVISTVTNAVIATVGVAAAAGHVAVTPDSSTVYVTHPCSPCVGSNVSGSARPLAP